MSTHAQITTIATYKIALLKTPPLAEPAPANSPNGSSQSNPNKNRSTNGHSSPVMRPM
jgi:hypothetical protein